MAIVPSDADIEQPDAPGAAVERPSAPELTSTDGSPSFIDAPDATVAQGGPAPAATAASEPGDAATAGGGSASAAAAAAVASAAAAAPSPVAKAPAASATGGAAAAGGKPAPATAAAAAPSPGSRGKSASAAAAAAAAAVVPSPAAKRPARTALEPDDFGRSLPGAYRMYPTGHPGFEREETPPPAPGETPVFEGFLPPPTRDDVLRREAEEMLRSAITLDESAVRPVPDAPRRGADDSAGESPTTCLTSPFSPVVATVLAVAALALGLTHGGGSATTQDHAELYDQSHCEEDRGYDLSFQVSQTILFKVSAALSIAGSSVVLSLLWCQWRTDRKNVDSYQRIMAAYSIYNLLFSFFVWFLGPWMAPAAMGWWSAAGNVATCSAQAFFYWFGLAGSAVSMFC